MQVQVTCLNLDGTNYEIGYRLGTIAGSIPQLKQMQTSGWLKLNVADAALAVELFERWCPGLNEEIRGFADALKTDPMQITFYAMTYLKPGCSHMALMPGVTKNGHTLVARNYEFSPLCEDFVLARTAVRGKYAHLGTSVLQFGRDDGLNEYGLSVTMSSCGMPVGAMEKMRKPRLRGLQFWAVVRALLENCRDVQEALLFLKDLPLAYNINLILADKGGNAALYETMDGNAAYRTIDVNGPEITLHANNHVLLKELKHQEPAVMKNSLVRDEAIRRFLEGKTGIAAEELQAFLLECYPKGLRCGYYNEFFGTTKSMVMDLNEGSLSLCWGGDSKNGWHKYSVAEPLTEEAFMVEITQETPAPAFFEFTEL